MPSHYPSRIAIAGGIVAGHQDHLFKRRGSQNWHARFHFPRALHAHFGRKMVDVNLKTPDRREAELLLPDLLKEHRLSVFEAENRQRKRVLVAGFGYVHSLGSRIEEDGTRVVATEDTVLFLKDGRVVREEPNELRIIPTHRFQHEDQGAPKPKKAAAVTDTDFEHIERWFAHKSIGPYLQKEAQETFRLFKELTGGKLFKDADRDDGRKVVTYLFEAGNKSSTVQKKMGHLCAAVNLAMSEGKLKFNPFSSIIPKMNDAERREPMTESDMAKLREGRHRFKPEEWLLFALCATTGMRRAEAYGIEREFVEGGIRFCIVGQKTDQSERRVPLPSAVLPFLPSKISGPLFKKDLKNLGRETLRTMRRIGVENDLHALRHRAKDRLRAVSCPLDIQHHLLGHEERTVASGYGRGYPIPVMAEWAEKIGL